MAPITFTPFVAGQTLTDVNLTQQQTEITDQVNGNLDSTNIVDGGIQLSKLVNQQAVYTITVPMAYRADALATGAITTARVGVNDDFGSPLDIPVAVPVDSELFEVILVGMNVAGSNTCTMRIGGGSVAATALTFVSGVARTGTISVPILASDSVVMRLSLSAGASDGVVNPYAILCLKTNHVV